MVAIPNDKGRGKNWRLNKFVEYQHYAPAVDPLTYCEYAKRKKLTLDNCIRLAWYHSLTYCEVTAAFLLEQHKAIEKDPDTFWAVHKPTLIFGSARRYVQSMNWFVPLVNVFNSITDGRPYEWLVETAGQGRPLDKFNEISEELASWKFMGRFSVDLFTEALIAMNRHGLIPLKIEAAGYDWKKSSNLTSGLLNIFYMDEEADDFDKTGKLPVDTGVLDDYLGVVLEAVHWEYPDQDVDDVTVINKICSFRNLFKASRYGGFHHDRQQGNLILYKQRYPEYPLWKEMYKIRAAIFPEHMLGEKMGWKGIRTSRKKLWLEQGRTGVETSR
jgi:hypothetical protein